MSTHGMRDLRASLGAVVREVAISGEEAIITDSGTEVTVIINMAEYERLHEHADVVDSIRMREHRAGGFRSMSMAELLDRRGVAPDEVVAA